MFRFEPCYSCKDWCLLAQWSSLIAAWAFYSVMGSADFTKPLSYLSILAFGFVLFSCIMYWSLCTGADYEPFENNEKKK